jgi:hypothetical protein
MVDRWCVARLAAIALYALACTGCGGSGAGETSTSGSGETYQAVTPLVNVQRQYARTIIDDANNTIQQGYADTVTAVNSDGSYAVLEEDPTHNVLVVNGTTYSIPTRTIDLDASGQETSYVETTSSGQVTCTFAPHGFGPTYPVTLGESWTLSYTFACGTQTPVTYTQEGSVIDAESVTVPAGTYTALKLQSTLSFTDEQGGTHTQTVTNWRDIATMFSVKQSIADSYTGTLPTGSYPTSEEIVLEAVQ